MRRTLATAALAALALLAAGCQGEQGISSRIRGTAALPDGRELGGDPVKPPGTQRQVEPETVARLRETRVVVERDHFVPASVSVRVLDRVTWTNVSDETHDIRYVSGPTKPFGSGPLSRSKSYTASFQREGDVIYRCTIHGFRGKVAVFN